MMRWRNAIAIIFCIVANIAIAKPPTPDYPAGAQQQTETANASELFQAKNPLFQTSRPIVVRFLQRPLSVWGGSAAQAASDGTVAHVQIVAYDKMSGQIVDNFGLTGNPVLTKNAKIFSETSTAIISDYDQNPLGEVEMSSDCYERVRDRTKAQLADAYYSALNNVNLKGSMVAGATMGAVVGGGITGAISGGVAGAKVAVSEYDQDGRRDYKIVNDKNKQMSFPGLNCQSAVDVFLKNGVGEPTWRVIKEYRQPGEKAIEDNSKKTDKKCPICGAVLNADGSCPSVTKSSSSKNAVSGAKSASSEGRTMTDEEAISLLREDGSGIKAVADALKE